MRRGDNICRHKVYHINYRHLSLRKIGSISAHITTRNVTDDNICRHRAPGQDSCARARPNKSYSENVLSPFFLKKKLLHPAHRSDKLSIYSNLRKL